MLHGHEHLDLSAELAGPGSARIPVRGIQSGSYDPGAGAHAKTGKAAAHAESHRARYRIFTIETSGGARPRLVGEELRGWRPEAGRFESEGGSRAAAA